MITGGRYEVEGVPSYSELWKDIETKFIEQNS